MKYYDVIILGAGIAGCGLAYNLRKFGYSGSVLIIDDGKKNNLGYGHRIVSYEDVKEYNLPFSKKFKRLDVGMYNKVYFSIDYDFYFVNYAQACEHLREKSGYHLIEEKAKNVENNILITENNEYGLKYLIDCTGSSFFLRKKFGLPIPDIYWIVKTRKIQAKPTMDYDSFSFFFSNGDYFEDVYPMENEIIQGDWLYTRHVDFSKLSAPVNSFMNTYLNEAKVTEEKTAVFPVSPVMPLVSRNYAFLGDSFGNALPSVGTGFTVILDSSVMLAEAIIKKDLYQYKKKWTKKYLEKYLKIIALKENTHFNHPIVAKMKKYPSIEKILSVVKDNPEQFLAMVTDNGDPNFTKKMRNIYPRQVILWQIFHYLAIKFKYLQNHIQNRQMF